MTAQNINYHILLKFSNVIITKHFVIGVLNFFPQQYCKNNSYDFLQKFSVVLIMTSLECLVHKFCARTSKGI